MPMTDRQIEDVVNHLRAIRRAVEPQDDDRLVTVVRHQTAQGMIDAAIALIVPPTRLPPSELSVYPHAERTVLDARSSEA